MKYLHFKSKTLIFAIGKLLSTIVDCLIKSVEVGSVLRQPLFWLLGKRKKERLVENAINNAFPMSRAPLATSSGGL